MADGEGDGEVNGRIPRICREELDEIKSAIPEHLLENASPAEKDTWSTVSVLDQRTKVMRGQIETLDDGMGSLEERELILARRLTRLEGVARRLNSYWVVGTAIVGGLLAIGGWVFKAIEFFWKHFSQ